MEFTDYYNTLGVSRAATDEEIQKAYRKLARQYHPDVSKSTGAEDRFKEIGEAYEVLKDPDKRSKYDKYGAAWKQMEQNGNGFGGFDFSQNGSAGGFESFYDILEHLFGGQSRASGFSTPFGGFSHGFNGRMSYGSQRGEDYEARVTLSLEEAAAGGSRMLTIPRPGEENRRLRVTIPRGVTPGQRIRLSGQGGNGQGGSGDLYLVIDIAPHPKWSLKGRDLHTQLAVPLWVAALGGRVDLQTLSGKVKVKVPAGSSSGKGIRLKGQGYPSADGSGDLYAEIAIKVPDKLTKTQKAAYETLKSLDSEEVSNGSQ